MFDKKVDNDKKEIDKHTISDRNNVGVDIKEYVKKMDSMMFRSDRSPLDEAFKLIVELMHDPKKVLLMGNFTPLMQFYVMKAVIVRDWFVNFFMNIEIKINFEELDKYPYYKRNAKVIVPDNFNVIMRESYWNTMSDIFTSSGAVYGKAREQDVKILIGAKEEIEKDERNILKYAKDKLGLNT